MITQCGKTSHENCPVVWVSDDCTIELGFEIAQNIKMYCGRETHLVINYLKVSISYPAKFILHHHSATKLKYVPYLGSVLLKYFLSIFDYKWSTLTRFWDIFRFLLYVYCPSSCNFRYTYVVDARSVCFNYYMISNTCRSTEIDTWGILLDLLIHVYWYQLHRICFVGKASIYDRDVLWRVLMYIT